MASDALGAVIVLGFRGLSWAWFALPGWARVGLGSLLGGLLRRAGVRAGVARENLAIAYPGESAEARAARENLFREAYRHLGNLVFEVLMVFGPLRSFATDRTRFLGYENWKAAHDLGKGVLFLSSHVGNWEIMSAAGALRGMDLMLVTKRLKPDWLHRAIEAGRLRCGVKGTYEPRTMRDVLAHLKAGKTVGFVLDQYAGPPVGVRVPVFGVAVGTSTALATLAKRTGAPVVPVVNYRTPEGGFVVDIQPMLEWKTEEDPTYELAVNTARYAARLEEHIRAHPEQWLWIHRRFKGDLSALREGEWREGRSRR